MVQLPVVVAAAGTACHHTGSAACTARIKRKAKARRLISVFRRCFGCNMRRFEGVVEVVWLGEAERVLRV